MQQLARQLRESTFIRQNAILFIGSMSLGFLNYLLYPVLGRLLHPNNFGEVQTLASLLAQVLIFLNVFGLITVNIVANYTDAKKRNRLIIELERLALFISVALLIATALGSIQLKQFFNFSSAWPFIMLVLAITVSVPLTFRNAFLRGRQRFGLVSWVGVIGSAADLVLAVIFVLLGWHTTGAIAGLLVGQIIALSFAVIFAHRQGFSESLHGSLLRLPDIRLIRPELKYAFLVLVCSLAVTGMYSIDTIVVKHYFDARTAGLYAGIATIARIVFFLTASVVQVLLPSVKLKHTVRQNQQVLFKSFLLMTAIGGIALLGFSLFPNLIIRILMGSTYLVYANLLPRLSLVIFIISLSSLFIMYHLALRRYAIMYVALFGIVTMLVLLRLHHHTLIAIIDSLFYSSLSMMAVLGIWLGSLKLRLAWSLKEGGI